LAPTVNPFFTAINTINGTITKANIGDKTSKMGLIVVMIPIVYFIPQKYSDILS